MSDFLFSEFNEVSAKEWKQKVQVDLKGADYNDTLIWKNLEGIDVKPFYHQDDAKYSSSVDLNHPSEWNIAQSIFIDDEAISNHLIINTTERGAEAVVITAEKKFNIERVFENFPFETCSIYFNLKFHAEDFYIQLSHFFLDKKTSVYYNIDIIGNLARTGNWFHNLNQDHEILRNTIQKISDKNILSVDGALYQNAGANMVQQIAYCLAHANEYLNYFTSEKNTGENQKSLTISFNLAVGTNYFFEIAKIRSLRKLYTILAKEYGLTTDCHIVSIPTKRNKTLYDYNVNLLRTTTENMSAVLGGANTVCSLAYDSIYHKSNEFGERIARNQLLILKEESYFKASDDPSRGSYYIESLSQQMAEKALILFKNIEASGGFLKQLKEGVLHRKIKESAEKEQQLFDNGDLVLLGTNMHPNENDRMKDDLELYPFSKIKARKTLIAPILERRLAEKKETKRVNQE